MWKENIRFCVAFDKVRETKATFRPMKYEKWIVDTHYNHIFMQHFWNVHAIYL